MKRPLAYITAHWGDNEFENTENAAKYCRLVYEAGFSPICPLLFLPLFLKDSIPQEHKDGIDMARDYLRRASVLVVCGGTVDEAMKNDNAEYRKLKPQFPRCRFKKEFFPEGIYLHIQNGRRHCDVEVGTGIHINCWRNERYGRDDDLCSWSYNPPKDDQVAELSRYLQEVHFPLLEQPECRSDELFPAIWE